MYSVVLMVAATSGGDMASFGKDRGCNGCAGYTCNGCDGGCKGGGFLGLRDKMGCNGCSGGIFGGHKSKGCDGGCHGTVVSGCHGTVVATPAAPAAMPAPVVHPAPVAGCHGSHYSGGCHGCDGGCHGCKGGGFLGMRNGGGLFGKKGKGCHGGCYGGCW